MIGDNQHAFLKGKLCLTNLMAFYNGVIEEVNEARETDMVTRTCAKHLTPSHTLPFSPDCRDMYFMDKDLAGWLHSKRCGQQLRDQEWNSKDWERVTTGTSTRIMSL